MYNEWHRYWITIAEESDRPVYFFRFEDVLQNPRKELTNLFKFILGVESLEGTVMERRIEDVLAMGDRASQTYKPREGGINKNLHNFTPEMIDQIKKRNEDVFHIFGYVKDDRNDDGTPFMDYEGTASAKSTEQLNYFKKLN